MTAASGTKRCFTRTCCHWEQRVALQRKGESGSGSSTGNEPVAIPVFMFERIWVFSGVVWRASLGSGGANLPKLPGAAVDFTRSETDIIWRVFGVWLRNMEALRESVLHLALQMSTYKRATFDEDDLIDSTVDEVYPEGVQVCWMLSLCEIALHVLPLLAAIAKSPPTS